MNEVSVHEPLLSGLSDQEITDQVAQTDLISLLLTVAGLLDDTSLLREEFRPKMIASAADTGIDYGLDAATLGEIRQIVIDSLIKLRDSDATPKVFSQRYLEVALAFIAGDNADPAYLDILRRELAWGEDIDLPQWKLADVAPDRKFKVAIIGAGVSGVLMATRLMQAGIPFTVFERSSDVGGVWCVNTYPGCRLDSSNFTYSYSYSQKNWRNFYSTQPEILEYFSDQAKLWNVEQHIRFHTEVLSADYSDGLWNVTYRDASGEHTEKFQYVVSAVGQLSRPKIPDFPGLDTFTGEYWHTAEWPADADITGKRVAVIGTGASAYQVVPSIAGQVGELVLFQRTAPWILPTPVYSQPLPDGFSKLLHSLPLLGRWNRFVAFWVALEGRIRFAKVDPEWNDPLTVSALNKEQRDALVADLTRQFADAPEMLEHVIPNYPPGGKRMLRDDGSWSKALMQDNVTLVPHAVESFEGNTIIASDGSRHEVDVVVFATGFKASEFLEPMVITGKSGQTLHDHWNGEPAAYLGVHVDDFPNFAMLYGPNTNLVVNGSLVFLLECGVYQIMSVIERMIRENHAEAGITHEAAERFKQETDAANRQMAWGSEKVDSWYKAGGRVTAIWPLSLLDYWKPTRQLAEHDWRFN
ncbi:flavin-containing monooxygenase [Leucobacter sp. W1038]|uniref:flavin-containing monooxygenase n=1 Tax=Leucobacter sp. W1038 TaxID=3438281 RepID=UPI003D97E825